MRPIMLDEFAKIFYDLQHFVIKDRISEEYAVGNLIENNYLQQNQQIHLHFG